MRTIALVIGLGLFCCTGACDAEQCEAIARSCIYLSDSECEDQEFCNWFSESDDEYCAGEVKPCSRYDDKDDCEDQQGCEWK